MATKTTDSSSSIDETCKKVTSVVLPSIKDHVSTSNKSFDSKKDDLDFLQVKNGLLLSYLIDLTKLLQYQNGRNSSSNSSKRKPSEKKQQEMKQCLQRLNEMKVIIEKIKPLEKKMRYQIDKLLTISSTSSSFALGVEKEENDDNTDDGSEEKEAEEDDDDNLVQMEESDPLAFRPNLDGFGNDDGSDDDENIAYGNTDESEEDDEEIMAAKAALKAGRTSKKKEKSRNAGMADDEDYHQSTRSKTDGLLYKSPRLAAVPFSEHEEQQKKDERKLKKQRERMRKSELLSTLKATYGDMPEEDDFGGGASLGKQRESARRLAEREAEKTKFEEAAFIRLTTSKKEKKMRNRIMREEVSNLHSIADIGNLTAGVSMAFGDEGNNGSDDDIIRVSGSSRQSSRHGNGKRRRTDEYGGGSGSKSKRRNDTKNSYQKALFGIGDNSGGKKKKKKK